VACWRGGGQDDAARAKQLSAGHYACWTGIGYGYIYSTARRWDMASRSLHSSFGNVAIYGAPLLLAIVELLHPQPNK
jgi:hypothetical protein